MTLEDSLKSLAIDGKVSKEELAHIINGNNFALFSGLLSHPDLDPDLKSQLQGALAEFNSQNLHQQKPTIIYIAENDHGDMTYSSLLKKMIEDCDSRDLKIKVFSEFPNQTDKVTSQKLKNLPAEPKLHNETTEFLDARMIPMGDLKARYNKLFPESWNSYSAELTPSQLFKNYKDQIDNLEVLELMEEEVKSRIEKESIFIQNPDLRIIGEGNSAGKDKGGDLHNFNRFRTSFHFKHIHSQMASDVVAGLDGDEDVIIMIAGTPHIPGLGQELESKFKDSPKLVIGNFQERSKDGDQAFATLGKKSCPAVGEVVAFEVDPDTKQALIPIKIQDILDRSKQNMESLDMAQEATSSPMTNDITILDEIDSRDVDRVEEIWPIMSTSKAFCGALIASTASNFGEDGINSSVRDSLIYAKARYPDRADKIDSLILSLEISGAADLKIAKILNHTSGLNNNNTSYHSSPKYQAEDTNKYFSEMEIANGTQFSYSNNGYYLLEEIVNLTSESGDYHQEIQNKIINPLGLQQTKFLSYASQEEKTKIGEGGFVMPYPNSFTTGYYEETYPIRELSAAAGGLLSSPKDLEIFFKEYTKMMLGENSALIQEGSEEISSLYKEMIVQAHGDEYFSLGVMLTQKDVEGEKRLLIGHDGGHASNYCHSRIILEGSIEDFKSGTLQEGQNSQFELKINKTSATAGLLKYAVLFHVLEGNFKDKIATLDEESQKDLSSKLTPEKKHILIREGLLPENFNDFEGQIYEVTKDKFFNYLRDNYLDAEGRINETALIEDYESDKIGFYQKVLGSEAQIKIDNILKRSEMAMPNQIKSEAFLINIPDPEHPPGDNRGTIEQFTPKGLKTAVTYYNQKYPERGEISQVTVTIKQSDRDNIAKLFKSGPENPEVIREVERLNDQMVGDMAKTTLEKLAVLKEQGGTTHKIALTIANEVPGQESLLAHTIPFSLTQDKLILLRDENDQFGQKIFQSIADNLGVNLIQHAPPIYDKKDPKKTSIQGDHSSCHFIALGVLKDLTQEDLKEVSNFQNGFSPLSKSLKYSQSTKHIRNVLDENAQKISVKNDGRTAEEYTKQHREIGDNGIITRITDKFNRFKADLSETSKELGEKSTPQEIASAILSKRELQKENGAQKEKESFVKKLGLEKTVKQKSEILGTIEESKSQGWKNQLNIQKSAKPESYVERMQAGKYGNIGSKGGANEL